LDHPALAKLATKQVSRSNTMLRGLIAFCLLRRPLVLVAYAVFLGLGFVAFTALNIEAYPDPAPPIIEIIAQRPLFGVSAMDGILLVSYIRRGIEQGRGSENAIINAGQTRMRQIFMTGFSACIGLVPAAVSTGIGSQVQQPLACVIVGGMLLSPFCSLLVIPTFSRMFMPAVPRTDDAPAGHAAVH
jgi:Cu/Ag efflux pump CusA